MTQVVVVNVDRHHIVIIISVNIKINHYHPPHQNMAQVVMGNSCSHHPGGDNQLHGRGHNQPR